MVSPRCRQKTALLAMTTLGLLAVAAAGEEVVGRYVAALRQRRLDRLLERFCESRLANPALPEAQRVPIVLDYSDVLATKATQCADSGRRRKLWESAARLLAESLDRSTDLHSRLALRIQQATLNYTRGHWLAQLLELEPADAGRLPAPLPLLASAVQQLQELDREVFGALAEGEGARRTASQRAQASALAPLGAVVRRRLGVALVALAKSSPSDAPGRRVHLELAIEHLQPNGLLDADEPDVFAAMLELLSAYRLLGQFDRAGQLLQRLETKSQTPSQRDTLVAERIDWLLDQGKRLDALELLQPLFDGRTDPPPRWRFLYLKLMLEQADAMSEQQAKASKLQASAFRQLRKLEATGTGPWTRRAELLLSKHASRLLGQDVAELQQAAESLRQSAQHRESAIVLRRAADIAQQNEQLDQAFALRYEAGRAWERTGAAAEAAADFEQLANSWPDHPQAPEALLRSIFNVRRLYLSTRDRVSYKRLDDLLGKHARAYPADESAGEVQFLLGALRKAEKRYGDAVRHFGAVADTHRLRLSAHLEMTRVYEEWVRPLTDNQQPLLDTAQAAAALCERLLDDAATPASMTADQRAEVTVRLARFLLDARLSRYADAERRLKLGLQIRGLANVWTEALRRHLIVAAVLQDDFRQADRLALEQVDASVSEQLATLGLLNNLCLYASELRQRFVGQVQRRFSESLERRWAEIPKDRVFAASFALAQVLMHLGTERDVAQATTRLEKLKAQAPRDARVAEALARCAMRGRRYDAAIEQWRQLLAGVRPGSSVWYRAKLSLATCLRRSGQREQAAKLIAVLEVLHPELGGPVCRERFLDEQRRCQQE